MALERKGTPRHIEITKAHQELLKELPNAPIDVVEASRSCWACGYQRDGYKPQRAHIIASAHGGSDDDPSNYFLLCSRCHNEQPDAHPFEVQLVWLKIHRSECELNSMLVLEVRRALKAAAEERGGIHLFEEYCEAFCADEEDDRFALMKSLMEEGARKSAGTSWYQLDANAMYAIVAAFIKWADSSPSQGDNTKKK